MNRPYYIWYPCVSPDQIICVYLCASVVNLSTPYTRYLIGNVNPLK